jgi:hypothetical protein
MKRADYEKKLSNEAIVNVIDRLEQLYEVLDGLAEFVRMNADLGREVINTRRSIKQVATALDKGEFMKLLAESHPEAAAQLSKAEILRFELGRMHIRFRSDHDKANFGWHRYAVEALAEKLYKVPCKLQVKQSEIA